MSDALTRLAVKLAAKYPVVAHLRPSPTGEIEHVEAHWREYGTKLLGGGIDFPGRHGSSNDFTVTRALMHSSPYYLPRLRQKATGSRELGGVPSVTPSLGRVIPGVSTKDYAELPFLGSLHSRMGVDVDFTDVTDYARKRDKLFSTEGSLIDVPLDGLVTTQRTVASPDNPDPIPLIAQWEGTFYLIHGHDRASVDAQSGAPTIKALVVNLDQQEFRSDDALHSWEKPAPTRDPEFLV